MFNPNLSNLMLRADAGVITSIVLAIIAVILGICLIVVIWWVDVKKQPIGKIWSAIGKTIYGFFDKVNDLLTNNLPVKTVYSDKSLNYSETEFLPIPSKAPTKQYTYTFLGWDKNGIDEKGNIIVRAIYLQRVHTVLVNFYGFDRETLIANFEIDVGSGVDTSNIIAERQESKEFTYEFACWDKDTTALYENTNVYPVFKAVPKRYEYKFFDSDRETILSQGSAIYGTPITPPPAPSKEPDGDRFYEFSGWKNYVSGMTLTKDIEFFAEYNSKKVENSSDVKNKNFTASYNLDKVEELENKGKKRGAIIPDIAKSKIKETKSKKKKS